MQPKRWQEIERLYHLARDKSLEERQVLLAQACAGDDELRKEVESLLSCGLQAGQFIESPALDAAARALAREAREESAEVLIGRTISHYRVIELLGRGGMGMVFKAEDLRLNRAVALKFLSPERAWDSQALERFRREASASSALNHPHICTIHDIDECQGRYFIAMEFLEGHTLKQRIQGRQLSLDEIVDLGLQIAEGLQAAHAKGIVHRDIKPANIFISDAGYAKILDFGLAKLLPQRQSPAGGALSALQTEAEEQPLTGSGTTLGTVPYMSPEQALGKELDWRTDLFSLGVVLYEMATGVLPFRGDSSAALLDEILHKAPTAPVRLNPGLSERLEQIISKALEKDRELRYQSAGEVLVDLKRLKRESDSARSAIQVAEPPAKKKFLRPAVYAIIAAAVLLAVAALSYLVWKRGDKPEAVPMAATHRQISFVGDAEYPAISPDGKSVVYVTGTEGELQRLMLQDLTGGQSLELLKARILSRPIWSPDGSEILAYRGQDGSTPSSLVLIPRLGQSYRILAHAGYSCWSPDGALVAITAQSYSSFKVVNKTTGESKQISLSGIPIIDGIDWAPSRNFLLFWAHTKDRKYSIWIVRPDGTQLRKVLEEETLFSARWGPKGTAIYYFRSKGDNDELCKIGINPESGEASGPATVLIGGFQTGQSMTLAAQNSQLAVTKTLRYSNLYVADLSSRQKTSAVQISALTSGTSQYYDPSISPDGQWIAFASGSPSQIYKMPIQGGLPTQLTFYPQGLHRFPVWSPDGKRIAFGSNQGGSSQVWVVDAAGAQPKPFSKTQLSSNLLVRWAPRREIQYQTPSIRNYLLLDPVTEEERPLLKAEVGYLLRLRISPDGKWAAAYWNRAPEGIYLILIADGSAKLLTQGRYYPIGWSPEGKTIFLYYASNTRPQNTIWALSADGGSPRPVLTMPGMILGADITPDGQKFICRLGENKSDVWIVENFDPALKK